MARVVIAIDGDASGAEQALEQTKDGIEDLDSSTSKASQGFGRLNTGLVNFTAGANLISMGIQGLRSGIDILWESTERFFQSSEDGQEKWEELERQGRALKGLLFELFIGTSDQNEAFERMSDLLGDLVVIGRTFVGVISPLGNLIRSTVGFARDFAAALAGVDREARDAADGMDELVDEIQDAETRMRAFRAAFAQPSGVETINTLAETLSEDEEFVERWGEGTAEAFEQVAGVMFDMEMQADQMSRDVGSALNTFQNALSESSDILPGFRYELRELARTAEGQAAIWNIAVAAQQEWALISADASNAAADSNRNVGRSTEEATDPIYGMGGALGAAGLAAAALATNEEFLQQRVFGTTVALIEQKLEVNRLTQAFEEEMRRKDEVAKAEEATLLRMDALKEALDAKEEAREAKRSARVKIAQKGFEVITRSATSMATQMVKTGKQSREETRKMIGDELVALGAAGVAKAAMLLFEPGKQGLAAGLLAASITAMALGAKMGASAGAGGGPAAPASTQQPQSVTNVTFQNNFAQIGSREAFLRTTGDTFQQAVDEGYIAIPRGRG